MIAAGIEGEQVADFARVESVDRAARTVALNVSGVRLPACKIGRGVSNWGEIHVGDQVRATIDEALTVYLAPVNERAGTRSPDARVLLVDPSYRVIMVQYPNSRTATFKVGLHMRMNGIEAGDSVAIRPLEVVAMRVQRRWIREGSYRPSRTATSAR